MNNLLEHHSWAGWHGRNRSRPVVARPDMQREMTRLRRENEQLPGAL
jgi:hypothetical protein